MILQTEKRKVDTSKTCKDCIDVKAWKGIGHTETEYYTKKREAGKKVKKVYRRRRRGRIRECTVYKSRESRLPIWSILTRDMTAPNQYVN